MFKKSKLFLMLFLLVFGVSEAAFAENVNVNLTIGQTVAWVGEQIYYLPIAPDEQKGVTYVPFRFIGESLGARVDWDEKHKTVSFTTSDRKVLLYVGKNKAVIDGKVKFLSSVSRFKNYYVMVPLRMVAEVFGAAVDYNSLGRVVTIKAVEKPVAQFDLIPTSVQVGQPVQYYEYSRDPAGNSLVDWEWDGKKDTFDKPGTYTIRLRVKNVYGVWSGWAERQLTVIAKPNNPPQASFSLDKATVSQGEKITYTENSSDPDGDKIVDWKWTGKQNVFFAPGDYPVTLKVKDENGMWSDPYTQVVHVTNNVLLTEFQYNIANPDPGAIFPIKDIDDSKFENLQATTDDDKTVTLFFSDSPEAVRSNGILYADVLSGHVRLMYYHKNASLTRKHFYLIAKNISSSPVSLKYLKGGYSGPSSDDFSVGQMGIMRYFESYFDKEVLIPAGKWVIMNVNSNEMAPANPGETIYGLYDVQTSDRLKFMCVALDANQNLDSALPSLTVLNRDIHNRGTFENGGRTLTIHAKPNSRVIIGDGVVDKFLMGYDGLSQQETQNHGNYGVIYNIKVVADTPMVAIVNPRGGGFAGTFALNGQYFFAPKWGAFAFDTLKMATMLGPIDSDSEIIMTPPASSNLPIYLDFLPAK